MNALPVDQNLHLAVISSRQLYMVSAEDDLWADLTGAFFCESMGYHVRSGWHDMQAEDWAFYLDYMDQYFITK